MNLGLDAPGWRVWPGSCPEGVLVVNTGAPFFMGFAPWVCARERKSAGTV